MKSVVLCGSTKFRVAIKDFARQLQKLGVVVYEPHLYLGNQNDWEVLSYVNKELVSLGLTLDHFQKIRCADIVFIFNPEGYVGPSTTLEMGFATALGKPIYALSDEDDEIARRVLVKKVIPNATELVKELT